MSILFKRIKDWATSITAFRTGDVIPVDGPSGTAKMSKDNLLARTAENTLGSIHSLSNTETDGYLAVDSIAGGIGKMPTSTIFNNFAEKFDPTRTEQTKYLAGELVIVDGVLYSFTGDHYGVWTGLDAVKIDVQKFITPLIKKLSTTTFEEVTGTEEIKVLSDDNEVLFSIDANGHVRLKSLAIYNGTEFEEIFPSSTKANRFIDSDSVIITDSAGKYVGSIDKDGIHAKGYFIRETSYGNDEPLSVNEDVEIVIPSKFTAVVGDTLQLFYRGVVKHPSPYIYALNLNCDIGKNTPRFFEVTPTAGNVGNHNATLYVKTKENKVVGSASTTLKVVQKPTSPLNSKKILCFGDSLTAGGEWCAEAFRRLAGNGGSPEGLGLSNIEFCGRLTSNGAGYFGQGGWSWLSYTTAGSRAIRFQVTGVSTLSYGAVYVNDGHTYRIIENNTTGGTGNILCAVSSGSSYVPDSTMTLTRTSGTGDQTITYTSYSEDSQNPLWDYSGNKMTFVPYANEVSGGQIDIVYTLLTWNGVGGYMTNFSNILSQVKTFADTLHAEFPNAKMKLMGLQVPSVNGGVGANYGASGSYYDWYGLVVTALNMNKAYKSFAESEGYSDFVEFVNISAEFDSDWNMPYSSVQVNSRSSATEIRGTNGVHPSNEGYMQIGDAVYRNLCEFLQ